MAKKTSTIRIGNGFAIIGRRRRHEQLAVNELVLVAVVGHAVELVERPMLDLRCHEHGTSLAPRRGETTASSRAGISGLVYVGPRQRRPSDLVIMPQTPVAESRVSIARLRCPEGQRDIPPRYQEGSLPRSRRRCGHGRANGPMVRVACMRGAHSPSCTSASTPPAPARGIAARISGSAPKCVASCRLLGSIPRSISLPATVGCPR